MRASLTAACGLLSLHSYVGACMHRLIVVVFALISMTFVQPAEAQKKGGGGGPKWSTTAPLQVYDANGQVLGHYIGWSSVSLLDGTQRVDAQIPPDLPPPNEDVLQFLYETVDCLGPSYQFNSSLPHVHRNGWLFPNGLVVYPDLPRKDVSALSQRNILDNGSFGDCFSIDSSFEGLTYKFFTVGPGPYTVK